MMHVRMDSEQLKPRVSGHRQGMQKSESRAYIYQEMLHRPELDTEQKAGNGAGTGRNAESKPDRTRRMEFKRRGPENHQ